MNSHMSVQLQERVKMAVDKVTTATNTLVLAEDTLRAVAKDMSTLKSDEELHAKRNLIGLADSITVFLKGVLG